MHLNQNATFSRHTLSTRALQSPSETLTVTFKQPKFRNQARAKQVHAMKLTQTSSSRQLKLQTSSRQEGQNINVNVAIKPAGETIKHQQEAK